MRIYKRVEQGNGGTLALYGSGKWIRVEYTHPRDPEGEVREFFRFHGSRYYLGEFMSTSPGPWNANPPTWLREFDGYVNDSFYSGVVIKLGETANGDTAVKAYLFIS